MFAWNKRKIENIAGDLQKRFRKVQQHLTDMKIQ